VAYLGVDAPEIPYAAHTRGVGWQMSLDESSAKASPIGKYLTPNVDATAAIVVPATIPCWNTLA
jgi:hypothetical protein